jgi:GcrA cell cycle regulator
MEWTEERILKLRELFAQNKTSREIAAEFGEGLTRNAVCGKLHRLGLQHIRKATTALPKPVPPVDPLQEAWLKEKAREMRKQGTLCVQIAAELNRSRHWVSRATRAPRPQPLRIVVEPKPAPRPAIGNCTLFELTETSCRYPIGDPREPSFRFCGAQKVGISSYCAKHDRITHSMGTWSERAATRAP